MNHRLLLRIFCLLLLFASQISIGLAQSSAYVRNEGQWPDQVVAQYAYQHHALWFQNDRVRMAMVDAEEAGNAVHAAHGEGELNGTVSGHVYDMVFGSNRETQVDFVNSLPDYINYFNGSNRNRWKSEVQQFSKLSYHEVAEGVDLVWQLYQGMPKYTYYIGHRGDAASIELKYEGVRGLNITDQGHLQVQLKDFFIIEQKPYAFQLIHGEEKEVYCSFVVDGNSVRFEVGDYDKDYMLYVDPVIIASTYSGSSAEAFGHTATFDGPGNIYSAGRVFGLGYPTDTGSFDLTFNGPFNPTPSTYQDSYDICISKYNPDGSQRLYSTYLGGSSQELPHSLITNANGELHMLGSTNSIDFPTTLTANDTSHNGGQDIYVAKFSSDGTTLLGSSFIGGSGADGVNNTIVENFADEFRGEIMVDDSNQVFIASFTNSSNFPATAGSLQDTLNNNQDGVVVKLNADLSELLFATYLGGFGNDGAFGVKVNDQGRIYVAGSCRGQNFPIDPNGNGAFPNYQGGQADGFIVVLNSSGSEVLHSTYYGTLSRDHAFFLELDNDDNAYIFGWSNGNINSTPGKYEGPALGSYISKFSPQLDTVLWEVGFGRYSPSAFLVDQCTQIYVSGQTAVNIFTGGPNNTMNLSTFDTLNAVNNQTSGGFHLMTLSPECDSLESAFFYGPDSLHVDGGTSRFDKRGYVYQNVCDCTGQFPTTSWAYNQNMQVVVPPTIPSNVCDNCVFKIDFEVPVVAAYASVDPSSGCEPLTASFDNTGSLGSDHFWDFGDGFSSTLEQPVHTYDTAGVYEVTYVVSDTFGCNASDSATVQVTVVEDVPITIIADSVLCSDTLRIYASDTTLGNYTWSDGSTSFETFITDTGTYWLIADRPVCGLDTDTARLVWDRPFEITLPPDTGVCELGFSLDADDGFDSYAWNTGDSTASISVLTTGNYVITVTKGACEASDSIEVLVSFLNFSSADTVICDSSVTLGVQEPGGSVQWSTGDTTTSIEVSTPGLYWATVSNGFCFSSDTITISFNPPLINDIPDTISCGPFNLDLSGSGFDEVFWSTGDSGTVVTLRRSGVYWVQVQRGECVDRDTFELRVDSLGFNTSSLSVCDTNAFEIPVTGPPEADYLWNTGDTIAQPIINSSGVYTVTITTEACGLIDTVEVLFGSSPEVDLGDDLISCEGAAITLSIEDSSGSTRWSTGDTTATITVYSPGQYVASLISDGCVGFDTITVADLPLDLDSLFIVPNVMTPNGDGVNDVLGLRIVDPDLVTNYQLTVYNRWGVMQFNADFINHDWDGRNGGGVLVEEGTYFYIFRAETRCTDIPLIELKDNVTVLY